ncbi:MAG: thioredoxin domain-containing protein [bacterium]|nr:thioredoxin domain-containing protein [bacterium]
MDKNIKEVIEREHAHEERMMGKGRDYTLPISILVAGILIAGSVIYALGLKDQAGGPALGPSAPVAGQGPSIGNAVVLGDPSAPVTIIEYGDFQCPFCGRFFAQTEPLIIEKYVKTGKVKFVYKDYAFLGPESLAAAEAAKCAADDGKFWEYHNALYREETKDGLEHNGNLNRGLFLRLAKELGINESSFASCVDTGKYKSAVLAENAEALAVGVNGTPAFFVGSQFISGALPFAQFETAIEAELNK